MVRKYTWLKWKLLLITALGALAVAGAVWLLLHFAVGSALEDLLQRCFTWVVQALFGQDAQGAQELYQTYVIGLRHVYVTVLLILLLLWSFYLAMGRFTRWLGQISAGVHRVADGAGELVRLPRELAPMQEDLNSLQATLRRRQEEAKQEEQRKNDLLVFLAHDLKTPLTSVIGYLTLLRDEPDLTGEKKAKYTQIALDKALRLEDLMLEFFEITRESLHQTDAPPVEIQLSILLEQLSDEFMPQFQAKGLSCRTAIAPQLRVCGDPDKLARVFDNVLRNAVSYSTEGGVIEIEAARQEDRVVIVIRNEGLEIPEQELERVFEKFYRLDSARSTRTGGAGLGLAIAKEIVEAHGGSIRAEANGRKTAFAISLPSLP